jgi:hypothetical protein
MFPLPVFTYVKIGIAAVCLLVCFFFGWHVRDMDFQGYKAKQAIETQKSQEAHQSAADQIRKEKDAQINSINNQLVDAISELRKRPNRTEASSNGQGGTGSTLYAEDAEFLIREAARADIIRTGLTACYAQYDSLSK